MTDFNITAENLRKNGMKVFFATNRTDVNPLIKALIPISAKVGSGGSVTLNECGVTKLLRNGNYEYYDRGKPGLTAQEEAEIFEKEKHSDVFLSSANAITLNGELYNVDGRGNRVSCIAHGPKSVIIVAGKNKIVNDLNEAVIRVKTIAAPKNTARLKYNTYCLINSKCQSLEGGMTDGCQFPGRICCHYLISAFQRIKDRITVILVNEDLGY